MKMVKRRTRFPLLYALTRGAVLTALIVASAVAVCASVTHAQGPVPPLSDLQDAIREGAQAASAGAATAESLWNEIQPQVEAAQKAVAPGASKDTATANSPAPQIALPPAPPPKATDPEDDGYLDAEGVAREGGWIRGYLLPPLHLSQEPLSELLDLKRDEADAWTFPEAGPDVYSQTALVNSIWRQMAGRWHSGRFGTVEEAVAFHFSLLTQVIGDLFGYTR